MLSVREATQLHREFTRRSKPAQVFTEDNVSRDCKVILWDRNLERSRNFTQNVAPIQEDGVQIAKNTFAALIDSKLKDGEKLSYTYDNEPCVFELVTQAAQMTEKLYYLTLSKRFEEVSNV
jgi:hypothetical protein